MDRVLEPGDFISTADNELAAASISRLQAAQGEGLEALVLEQRHLERWLQEAPADQEKLLQVVQAQLAGKEPVSPRMTGGQL